MGDRLRPLWDFADLDATEGRLEAAYARALAAADGFLEADAAHMAALVAADRGGFEEWTRRGLAIAEASSEPIVRYWAGPLLNNLGWEYQDRGQHVAAVAAFQRALMVRLSFPEDAAAIQIARDALAEAIRSLGRHG